MQRVSGVKAGCLRVIRSVLRGYERCVLRVPVAYFWGIHVVFCGQRFVRAPAAFLKVPVAYCWRAHPRSRSTRILLAGWP